MCLRYALPSCYAQQVLYTIHMLGRLPEILFFSDLSIGVAYHSIVCSFRQIYIIIIANYIYQHFSVKLSIMNSVKMGKKDHLRNKSEYEVYEDDLNNYKNRSRSNIQQWNLIQSRLMPSSPNQQNKNISLPSIHKGVEQLNSPAQSPTILNRLGKEVTNKQQNHKNIINNSPKGPKSSRTSCNQELPENTNSYSYKIKTQFEVIEYNNKKTQDLQKQLKDMRQMLIELNDILTSKLNKYELASFTPKGMAVPTEPDKQEEILYAKIQTNSKIIEALEKQIKQIQQRDKELQQKDYLIELQESANLIMHHMRQKRKQKIQEGVAVEKLDSRLIQMRDATLEDQFKMVKVIKHNILYYFKKFNENKAIIEELDKNYRDLIEKDQKILKKYNQLSKIAEQKNMLVKSNRNYIQNKKIQDQLIAKVEQGRKKVQVFKRSNTTQCQKIERQNEKMKKQIFSIQNRYNEVQVSSEKIGKTIQQVIQKNQISKKVINSISYKFAQVLLKDSTKDPGHNTNKQSSQGVADLKAETFQKSKLYMKPKLKLTKQKQSLNNSTQVTSRYRTLDIEEDDKKLNDKNVQTINFQENKSKQFRIKPSLHIKKKSENEHSKMVDSIEIQADTSKINDSDIIYKPKRFQKILSLKKDKQSN